MICVVIIGPTFDEAYKQMKQALVHADLIELRLDYLTHWDESTLKKLRAAFSIPMIFTLRGCSQRSEEERLVEIQRLAALKPEYFDIESHVSPQFIQGMAKQYPEIKWILSYHDFDKTPEDLESIYREMKKIPAYYYKIAVKAQNSVDMLRLLRFVKEADRKVIGISMGSEGESSRFLAPIFGSPITYACLEEDQQSAPGQLTVQTLLELYRYRSLNLGTVIYGLLGYPLDKSISHVMHHDLFSRCDMDAVYIKMRVQPTELAEVLPLAKGLGIRGLSVTMPLKEAVLSYLDYISPAAKEIGAVNTLFFEEGKISGFNTDCIGCFHAIEAHMPIKGKKVVIIGAGGAAKAIVYEACRRGGKVIVLNRHRERAEQLAEKFSCVGRGLEEMGDCYKEGYDLLINTTPLSMPIDAAHLLPTATVMDITTRPKETLLLQHAREKGCQIIYGYQMFINQAVEQYAIWLKGQINFKVMKKILEHKAEELL